jgi:NADPH:quinone reductase-like Zn-dependent oxidoreductase
MRAVVHHEYGPPDVLRLEEVEKPAPKDDQLLVRVRAVSVNPLDWHIVRGTPYLMRIVAGLRKPKDLRVGMDLAGTVEAVGGKVTRFKPGDEVFGGSDGAFAEYVCVAQDKAASKPTNLTFEQAAAAPVAGLTALRVLRNRVQVRPGLKLLINGASGGVGTFAVQIAKAHGAHVTGVCSTRNVELVRSLGADAVVDYTKDDFTKAGPRFDAILDSVGNRSLSEFRRALVPDGRYLMVGGGGVQDQGLTGPLARLFRAAIMSKFVSQDMGFFMSKGNVHDWDALRDLMQAGKVTPVIDRSYPLSEIAEAMAYVENGHAAGKVVLRVE